MKVNKEPMSKTRKMYWLRFVGRAIIVVLMFLMYDV